MSTVHVVEPPAGRLDSTVGHAGAADLAAEHPHATLAVLDDAGHALPHEQPELLRALVEEWLTGVGRLAAVGVGSPAGTVAHHHLPLDEAPEAYEHFQKKEEGMVKVVFQP